MTQLIILHLAEHLYNLLFIAVVEVYRRFYFRRIEQRGDLVLKSNKFLLVSTLYLFPDIDKKILPQFMMKTRMSVTSCGFLYKTIIVEADRHESCGED